MCRSGAHLRPHQQHQSGPDRGFAGARASPRPPAGAVGHDGMAVARTVTRRPASRRIDAGTALRDIGARRYHNLHPFHRLLHWRQAQPRPGPRLGAQPLLLPGDDPHQGRVDRWRGWRTQPCAAIWRQRIIDHDGEREGDGGIERWLKLTDGLGLPRAYVTRDARLLPATRFAVEAYVHFVRERSLLEAIASSLTELFCPNIIAERVSGMLASYDFISTRDARLFRQDGSSQAPRDADFALDYVKRHATTSETAGRGACGADLQVRCPLGAARRAAPCLCRRRPCRPPGAWTPGRGGRER